MHKDAATPNDDLRRQAERRLKRHAVPEGSAPSPAETQRLLHELQVHQIELEMQNEELRAARVEVEAGLACYTDLYDFSPVNCFNLGADGSIRDLNLAGARLVGAVRDNARKARFDTFVAPGDRAVFAAFLQKVFDSQAKQSCAVTLVCEGFPPRIAEIEAILMPGNPRPGKSFELSVMIAVTDVTERRRAETVSKLQQARLEGIVNSAMDGIITVDEEQRVILINSAGEKMFDCTAAAVIGIPLDRFIPERSGIAARAIGQFGPIGIRSTGEEFPIEASISQILVDGQKLFTVTCRDITERIRALDVRQRLEAQLRQSQKMEAFGQLAGGVAHDFNNLLTVIGGYGVMLLNKLPPNDVRAPIVQAICRASTRAESLTRQLLAFTRQQVLEPRILDLNAVVVDVQKMLRRLIGEDVLVSTVLGLNLSPVKVDPGQLEQVIINLAVNARDAMPRGGKLILETSDVELGESNVSTCLDTRPGHYVMLAVSDTGTGISPEAKKRIFEPFFTTKSVGKGTGLGLAVVHGIVKQSGGSIDVCSEVGVGTTFKIYLPAVASHLGSADAASKMEAPQPGGKETILLVEDEADVRELAAFALESYGYTVLAATNGSNAIEVLKRFNSRIDLLVTDVVMPLMSGRELSDKLLAERPDLMVLFVSGYTDDAVVRHGVLQAQTAFLQKPYTPGTLARKVRSVLDQDKPA